MSIFFLNGFNYLKYIFIVDYLKYCFANLKMNGYKKSYANKTLHKLQYNHDVMAL